MFIVHNSHINIVHYKQMSIVHLAFWTQKQQQIHFLCYCKVLQQTYLVILSIRIILWSRINCTWHGYIWVQVWLENRTCFPYYIHLRKSYKTKQMQIKNTFVLVFIPTLEFFDKTLTWHANDTKIKSLITLNC